MFNLSYRKVGSLLLTSKFSCTIEGFDRHFNQGTSCTIEGFYDIREESYLNFYRLRRWEDREVRSSMQQICIEKTSWRPIDSSRNSNKYQLANCDLSWSSLLTNVMCFFMEIWNSVPFEDYRAFFTSLSSWGFSFVFSAYWVWDPVSWFLWQCEIYGQFGVIQWRVKKHKSLQMAEHRDFKIEVHMNKLTH